MVVLEAQFREDVTRGQTTTTLRARTIYAQVQMLQTITSTFITSSITTITITLAAVTITIII
jgi:hypothetical protein